MLSKLEGLTAQQSAVFHLRHCVLVCEFGSKFPEFQKAPGFYMWNPNEQEPLTAAFPNI